MFLLVSALRLHQDTRTCGGGRLPGAHVQRSVPLLVSALLEFFESVGTEWCCVRDLARFTDRVSGTGKVPLSSEEGIFSEAVGPV